MVTAWVRGFVSKILGSKTPPVKITHEEFVSQFKCGDRITQRHNLVYNNYWYTEITAIGCNHFMGFNYDKQSESIHWIARDWVLHPMFYEPTV